MIRHLKPKRVRVMRGNSIIDMDPDKLPEPDPDLCIWVGRIENYLGKHVKGVGKMAVLAFMVTGWEAKFVGDGFHVEYGY